MGPAQGVFDTPAGPRRGAEVQTDPQAHAVPSGEAVSPLSPAAPAPAHPTVCYFREGSSPTLPRRRGHQGLVWAAGRLLLGGFSIRGAPSSGCPPQQEPGGGGAGSSPHRVPGV